jgi:hypothetical protein
LSSSSSSSSCSDRSSTSAILREYPSSRAVSEDEFDYHGGAAPCEADSENEYEECGSEVGSEEALEERGSDAASNGELEERGSVDVLASDKSSCGENLTDGHESSSSNSSVQAVSDNPVTPASTKKKKKPTDWQSPAEH